ncbi:MAG: imidazolonepropionase, partial [Bacteroidales bacterium]|nr:imidazolonepropionase [Bacteroidales bacterium]
MAILVKNIKKLIQTEERTVLLRAGKKMNALNIIENAYLLTEGENIIDFGTMDTFSTDKLNSIKENITEIDASGKMVFPSFCDSHTHLVYAGSREIEYIDKIRGY